MSEIRECVDCGASIPEGHDRCPDCGLPVGSARTSGSAPAESAPAPAAPKPAPAPRKAPRPPGEGISRGLQNTIVGVAVAIGMVTLFLIYLSHQPKPAGDAGDQTRADNGRVTADEQGSSGAGMPPGMPPAGAAGAAGSAPPLPASDQEKLTKLKELVDRQPFNVMHVTGLANELYDAGRFDEAVPYYRRVVALDPANADLRVDLATCLYSTHKTPDAISELDTVLSANPRHANALYNRGVMESSMGNNEEADKSFAAYVKYNPNGPRVAEIRSRLKSGGKTYP